MLTMQTRLHFAAIAGLLVLAAPAAQSEVIWSENFDAATPGQAVSDPPLNWTADYGTIVVQAAPHAGWVGNAIIGSAAIDGGLGGAQASVSLPATPADVVLEFSFDAWAPTSGGYGAHVQLDQSNGDFLLIQAWANVNFYDSWFVYRWSASESRYTTQWVSDSYFMRDRTVRVVLSLDPSLQTFFASFDDSANVVSTPVYNFDATAPLTTLRVYEDRRGGSLGVVDFDNFQLAAVPEPGTWLLISGGLAALGWRARRTR